MNLYIYKNLNLNTIVKNFTPDFKFDMDKAYYFLHLISWRPITRREDDENENGFVPISSSLMQEYGVRDFKSYRLYFVRIGVLEERPFSEGKARSFRFTKEYRGEIEVLKSPDTKFWKRVERLKIEYYRKSARSLKRNGYEIVRHLNPDLKIDVKAALKKIDEEYEKTCLEDAEKAIHQKNQRVVSVSAINNGDFFYKVDDYGRLHTNLTNLSTILRQFLSYYGEGFANIDFVNSQPMLISLFLETEFWKDTNSFNYKSLKALKYSDYRSWNPTISSEPSKEYLKNSSTEESKSYYTSNSSSNVNAELGFISSSSTSSSPSAPSIPSSINTSYTLTLTKTPISLASTDVQRYINWTRNGEFYEQMQKTFDEENISRKEIKGMTYEVFFGNPTTDRKRLSANKHAFMKEFPTVMLFFDLIKAKNNATLAHLAQSAESKLMFEYLVPHVRDGLEDMPIYTIHDSFLVPVSMAEEVKEAISIKFNEVLGFIPKLKIE
jgi:hypothetical protein